MGARYDFQLWQAGDGLAMFVILVPLCAILLALVLTYLAIRIFATIDSKRDEPRGTEAPRRARPAAVLIVLSALAVGLLLQPSLRAQLYASMRKSKATDSRNVRVWANKRLGLYYCPGAIPYGSLQPGQFMPQWDTIQSGYQPSPRQMCR